MHQTKNFQQAANDIYIFKNLTFLEQNFLTK